MIGSQMAFATVLGLPGRTGLKRMLRVAGDTNPFGAVGINAADTGVGPCIMVHLRSIGLGTEWFSVLVALQRHHGP